MFKIFFLTVFTLNDSDSNAWFDSIKADGIKNLLKFKLLDLKCL